MQGLDAVIVASSETTVRLLAELRHTATMVILGRISELVGVLMSDTFTGCIGGLAAGHRSGRLPSHPASGLRSKKGLLFRGGPYGRFAD